MEEMWHPFYNFGVIWNCSQSLRVADLPFLPVNLSPFVGCQWATDSKSDSLIGVVNFDKNNGQNKKACVNVSFLNHRVPFMFLCPPQI